MLNSLIGLFESPQDTITPDDDHFIDIEDSPGNKYLILIYLNTNKSKKNLFSLRILKG